MDIEKNGIGRKSFIFDLHSKYAARPWSDTFQLVRRCMEKTRTDAKPCEPIVRCLQKLQETLKVSSLSAMVSRLEMIAQHRGLRSHLSPTESICYLTTDLFYVEVQLLSDGRVDDVKVAQHGEAPVSNASLIQLLRMKKFEDFSLKLEDLVSLYSVPGDNDTKMKVYTAFQFLKKDLLKLSHLPRSLKDSDLRVDVILNGRIGNVTPCRQGNPMQIQYYISPSDILRETSNPGLSNHDLVALVTVGPSDAMHVLQMESLIPSPPQMDSRGLPVFRPLSEAGCEALPACFLLKLQPPVPMLCSLINKISHVIDDVIPQADLQWVPLPHLLTSTILEGGVCKDLAEEEDAQCLVSLPDSEVHSYLLSAAEWRYDLWRGMFIHTVRFSHPAHVPAILEILRHQSAINVLLASCITSQRPRPESRCDLSCEVAPESESSFSVTFHIRECDSLAVLLVTVVDGRQVICRLLMPQFMDHDLDEYISRVLTRCMSIPITMRAIRRRLSSKMIATERPAKESTVAKIESDPITYPLHAKVSDAVCIPDTNSSVPFSHNAVVTKDLPSPQTYYVMSVASAQAVDVNTDAVPRPSPCPSVGVFSHLAVNGLSPEPV
ncbi:mediator of RNA polymerase II transcription subunit 1-like [Chanos chanos]|uniref:Mediator of RNA polymerase II transcription subunit 1 n=1 Tax=Chanos chanos TaxID=29144 RepID=A0A6J2UVY0_CHACN|nr:mediator of RNA polymerase II transcription subunit 1-like [Chanos chanos]